MKKLTAFLALLILLAAVNVGCSAERVADAIEKFLTSEKTEDSEFALNTDETENTDAPSPVAARPESLPAIDGSTTTIPLAAAFRTVLLGMTSDEAMADVLHNGTYQAFYNLIGGGCDVILTAPISSAQQQLADEQGVEIELVPITRDGFVFLVNVENPVNSLTVRQIKDIYAGKITNWKEVGGNDAAIYAYQRNEDSGSQNFIVKLMDGTPLMKPVTAATPGSMTGLIEVIAAYDNAVNAIGYSFYSYAVDMNKSNSVKLVQIDGIAPSKTTMGDGTYPLTDFNYAVMDKNSANYADARAFVDWMITDDGQRVAADAGYIAVRALENYVYTEVEDSVFYTAIGTGMRKPDNFELPTHRYFARMPCRKDDTQGTSHSMRFGDEITSDMLDYATIMKKYHNNFDFGAIKNETLKAEINDFLNTATDELLTEENVIGYHARMIEEFNFIYDPPLLRVESQCVNGFLSVAVYLTYDNGAEPPRICYYGARTVVYDLVTGKKLSFSDMFYHNTSFVPIVNSSLIHHANLPTTSYGARLAIDKEFVGLTADFEYFTLDSVIFTYGNEYFPDGAKINFESYTGMYDYYVPALLRDFSDYVTGDYVDIIDDKYIPISMFADGVYFHDYIGQPGDGANYGTDFTIYRLKHDIGYVSNEVVDKVNDYMYNFILATQTRDILTQNLINSGVNADDIDRIYYGWYDWSVSLDFDKDIIIYETWFYEAHYVDKKDDYHPITMEVMGIPSRIDFDMKTGEMADQFVG